MTPRERVAALRAKVERLARDVHRCEPGVLAEQVADVRAMVDALDRDAREAEATRTSVDRLLAEIRVGR